MRGPERAGPEQAAGSPSGARPATTRCPVSRRRAGRRLLTRWLAGVLLAPVVAVGAADAKTIELDVPYAAGGYTDAVARLLAETLSQTWAEPVVVVNKPGAGGVIGTRHVIQQGDVEGRTLLMGSVGYLTTQFSTRGAPFDPARLAPVIRLGGTPSVLYVRAGIPADDFAGFVRWARGRPDGVTFGNSGIASSPHLNAEDLAARAGFSIVNVQFPGSSASIPALAGGHIDAVFESSGSRSFVENGRLKALMVGSDTPLPTWPAVPTADGAGLPGFRSGSWFGIFVAAGTPAATIARLNADLQAALASPALSARLRQMDFQFAGGTAADFARFLVEEREQLETLVRRREIRID